MGARKSDHARAVLKNPESTWEPTDTPAVVTDDDIFNRIGRRPGSWRVLSGGLANANILVGNEVLRIYRRDLAQRGKEAGLLHRPWRSFRVPKVIGGGYDFLLLEFIPNEPVPASLSWGRKVGEALAEIHANEFPSGGFLGGDLRLTTRLPDLMDALHEHAHGKFNGEPGRRMRELTPLLRDAIGAWTSRLREETSSAVLLHGDFKASNLRRAGGKLLVFDWEFAWAGPPLMDVGQMLRWSPPKPFIEGFAEGYRGGGGRLPSDWQTIAPIFDLYNLIGLLDGPSEQPRRVRAVNRRVRQTLQAVARR